MQISILAEVLSDVYTQLTPEQQDAYIVEVLTHLVYVVRDADLYSDDFPGCDPEHLLILHALADRTRNSFRLDVDPVLEKLTAAAFIMAARLQSMSLAVRAAQMGNCPELPEFPVGISDQKGFSNQLAAVLPDPYAKAVRKACGTDEKDLERTVRILLLADFGSHQYGILTHLTLDELKISPGRGLNQIRFVSHLVDEHDILSEQTQTVCRFLTSTHRLRRNTSMRITYTIDQPASTLMGNSVGLALALLGQAFLKDYQNGWRTRHLFSQRIAVTGTVNTDGEVTPIDEGRLARKLEAAFWGPVQQVLVPPHQKPTADHIIQNLIHRYPDRPFEIRAQPSISAVTADDNIIRVKQRSVFDQIALRTSKFWLLTGFAAVVLALFLYYYFGVLHQSEPNSFHPLGNGLGVVKNSHGYVVGDTIRGIHDRGVDIADLDGDGHNEILIGHIAQCLDPPGLSGTLTAYNRKRNPQWRIPLGKPIHFGKKYYDNTYSTWFVETADLDQDGSVEIITATSHIFFPTRIAVLNSAGEILSEYWNAGHFYDVLVCDLIPDNGTLEIVAAGVNNTGANGILTVLNPWEMQGGSPNIHHGEYEWDLAPGREIAYLVFPLTHMYDQQDPTSPRDAVSFLKVSDRNKISARLFNTSCLVTGCFVLYNFDSELTPTFWGISDTYQRTFNELYPDGPPINSNSFSQVENLTRQ